MNFISRKQIVLSISIVTLVALAVISFRTGDDGAMEEKTIDRVQRTMTETGVHPSTEPREKGAQRSLIDLMKAQKSSFSDLENEASVDEHGSTAEESGLTNEQLEMIRKIDERHLVEARVRLEKIHEGERADLQWTRRVTHYGEEMAASNRYPGTLVDKVDCRLTLCKVVLVHDGKPAMDTFRLKGGIIEGPWQEASQHGYTSPIENGDIKTTIYFSNAVSGSAPFQKVRNGIAEEVRMTSNLAE